MDQKFITRMELKPSVSAWLAESALLLSRDTVPSGTVIHDVRVMMKKARSALKLAASQLPARDVQKELAAMKAVAHGVRERRYRLVVRKVLKDLRDKYPSLFRRLAGNPVVIEILNKTFPGYTDSAGPGAETERLRGLLARSGARIRFMQLGDPDRNQLLDELRRTYRSTSELYFNCRSSHKPRKIHEFRKRAKDLLYQLPFFRHLNPGRVTKLIRRLERLTGKLGKYHDLEELRLLLYKIQGKQGDDQNITELILRIRDEQDSCLRDTWPGAFRIFRPGLNIDSLAGFEEPGPDTGPVAVR